MQDTQALEWLEHAREVLTDTALELFVREVVQVTWRANVHRWSPNELFDDANTLGYQSSRNVNNRLAAKLPHADSPEAIRVDSESGVSVILVRSLRFRLVKAPIEYGLSPDLDNGFDWTRSETRSAAARRNSSAYYSLTTGDPTLAYESDPRPSSVRQIEGCRDFFIVWAGQISPPLTRGWLGLPRIGETPWLGTIDLWQDAAEEQTDYGDLVDDD